MEQDYEKVFSLKVGLFANDLVQSTAYSNLIIKLQMH